MEVTVNLGTNILNYAGVAAGAKVGIVNISGGTAPYTVTIGEGHTKFDIVEENGIRYVKTKTTMDIWSMHQFDIICTDSQNTVDYSPKYYPRFGTRINAMFANANTIYKIIKDYDLLNGVLSIPDGCVLDFQGGKLTNVRLELNNTKIIPNGCNIDDYVSGTISGNYKGGQMLYDSSLKKMKLWNGANWVNLDGTALA